MSVVTGRRESGRGGMRLWMEARAVPVLSTRIAGLVDLFRSPSKPGKNNSIPTKFLSGCLADQVLLNWNPSQRKEAISQVAPWLAVPGGAGQGRSVPSREDEPGSCR